MSILDLVFKWYINAVVISILVFFTIAGFSFILYNLTDIAFSAGAEWVPATIISAIVSPILSTYIIVKNK